MKLLFDYFPIICFFIAYKIWGIYVATAVAMGACALQNIVYWCKNRCFEKLHIITFITIFVLGGFTLIFHNAIFIKWKPSIIYWAFSIALFYSQFFTHKNIIFRVLGDKITLPAVAWKRLNFAWALFFIFMGFLNIYVVYHYTTNQWVNFKLFGTLGLTLVFAIAQAVYMTKYVKSLATKST